MLYRNEDVHFDIDKLRNENCYLDLKFLCRTEKKCNKSSNDAPRHEHNV